MTVTLGEINESRSAQRAYDGASVKNQYTRCWVVKTDSVESEAAVLAACLSTVDVGSQHPVDTDSYCTDLKLSATNERLLWKLTASYSSENPLAIPAKVKISFRKEEYSSADLKDLDDMPFHNSALQPFPAPLPVPFYVMQISIQKNMAPASVDVSYCQSLLNKVNDDTWMGLAEKSVLCTGVSVGESQYQAGVTYVSTEWNLDVAPDGEHNPYNGSWEYVKILDQGHFWLDGADLKPFLDHWGNELPEASLLDGIGQPSGDPVFLEFRVRETADFSGIPTT